MSTDPPGDNIDVRLIPKGAADSSYPDEEVKISKKSKEIEANGFAEKRKDTSRQAREITADDKKKLYRVALNRIRAIMISLVVFFHCAASYQDDSAVFFLVVYLMRDWIVYVNIIIGESGWPMFVFYTLAGYAAYHSLRVRSLKDFVEDRSLRLIPPIFFGIFVLEAFTIYLMYYMGEEYWGFYFQYENFIDFYVKFYSNCFSLMIPQCPFPRYVIGIYWYLIYLWVFCILAIPFFLIWKQYPSPSITTKRSKVITITGFLLLPLVVWGLEVAWYYTKDFSFIKLFSESNFYAYFFFIFFGFFLAWCKDAHELLLDCCWFFAGFSIALIPTICYTDMTGLKYTRNFDTTLLLDVFAVFAFFAVWALAHKTLPYLPRRVGIPFDYIADRAIAIYVLHYVVQFSVLVVLYYIRGNSFLNYSTVAHLTLHYVLSYLCTLALYETLFRWKYTRFLVGMMRVSDIRRASKTKAEKPQAADSSPAATV